MNRTLDVGLGFALITSLWAWVIKSIETSGDPAWWLLLIAFCKIVSACLITAPVYREYLK